MRINLTETYLHKVLNETVSEMIKEESGSLSKCYWQCQFEDKEGNKVWKMIYAKTTPGAFKHSMEMGTRIGMEPLYETLRNATTKEVKEFIKNMKQKKG